MLYVLSPTLVPRDKIQCRKLSCLSSLLLILSNCRLPVPQLLALPTFLICTDQARCRNGERSKIDDRRHTEPRHSFVFFTLVCSRSINKSRMV
ncbi:hypothetical protein BT69DRAFT_795323 [Atractiella rhizophila]|nr:hypothetical protein BT69DRAFT_795323 [Atractiella rhizophila]